MAPIPEFHHRSTTKESHKPFKTKHASKNEIRDRAKGKVEKGVRRTPHQHVMSKFDRKNQAKQKRINNLKEHAKATTIFSGRNAAPRIVAVVPLSDDVTAAAAVKSLNGSIDIEQDVPEEGWVQTHMERFKQQSQYVMVKKDLLQVLDVCRAADFVLLVMSPEEEVDEYGEMILKSIESQGISNVFTTVQGLEKVEPAKRRSTVTASLKSFITHFFPAQERVYSLDSRQETLNLARSLCSTTPKSINWREDRSWMLVEELRWKHAKNAMKEGEDTGEVVLTGVIRGKALKADRLVHLADFGDFQISEIAAAPQGIKRKRKETEMAVDEEGDSNPLDLPTQDQEDLADLAPEEAMMDDVDIVAPPVAPSDRRGVLLDDHHYFEDEEEEAARTARPKRLPKGTSSYQAAWYLEDISDSGSDMETVDGEGEEDMNAAGSADPADGFDDIMEVETNRDPTEGGPSEYPESEMFLDPSPDQEAEQLQAYRKSRKTEADEDLEFPDEIELTPETVGRERLAKYRGLKSSKTSAWDTAEDKLYAPAEWERLLEINNYRAAKGRVLKESLVGGVTPGTRVHLHLKNVPLSVQHQYNPTKPLVLFQLLRHEHKRVSSNYSISLSSDYPGPIRSKEEIIVQCGPRRFIINPLFSQAGNTPNDVHKFERFLHPGHNTIATFIAPLTWGSVPVLYLKRTTPSVDNPSGLALIGTGTSLIPSQSRVIAKRIVLTGHPFKINKRVVTVRYMFFNKEDVQWFKALQLWTRRGRKGYIKESLGTHGYFKATFDGKISPMDSVALSLYKRVWPRNSKEWRPWEQSERLEKVDGQEVAMET